MVFIPSLMVVLCSVEAARRQRAPGGDPFERQRRPRQLHRMRWSPVGSAIILQSQVRSQHHLTGGSSTLLANLLLLGAYRFLESTHLSQKKKKKGT
ncbi:hypothetical protein F5882DRAFT_423272, partial [Hyaloscypha sp. PMI_1271]